MVTELMLQRVEADLKEVVQGPIDVTGRADDGRPVGAGLGTGVSKTQRRRKRVRGLRCSDGGQVAGMAMMGRQHGESRA